LFDPSPFVKTNAFLANLKNQMIGVDETSFVETLDDLIKLASGISECGHHKTSLWLLFVGSAAGTASIP